MHQEHTHIYISKELCERSLYRDAGAHAPQRVSTMQEQGDSDLGTELLA